MRQVFLLVLLTLGICFPFAANAATGSAIPEYSYPLVHIPRVDVEGYGALDLELILEDASKLLFGIASAKPADIAVAPGATYSLQGKTLTIPRLKAGNTYYQVTLQVLANNRFQVSELTPLAVSGQAEYQAQCANCHGANGLGGPVAVTLQKCKWCTNANTLANFIAVNMPMGGIGKCTGTCAENVANYILTAFNTNTGPALEQTLSAIQTLVPEDALRKASLQLVSRLPTAAEIAQIQQGGNAELPAILAKMMDEPAFYARLSEMFNDFLQTNRYLASNGDSDAAVELLPGFTKAYWYDPGAALRDSKFTYNQQTTNDSIATEPLELINYVVKNNLPASEILTADYFMVNGYSAKSYGITNVTFNDEWDPTEFKPAKIPNFPHAGILSSRMFLNRYGTTATNRNRARARVTYDIFLDVNILALDDARPNGGGVDIVSKFPTMENPACVKCHTLIDPLASSFMDWNFQGRYVPLTVGDYRGAWNRDMFLAGFGGQALPTTENSNKLRWIAKQITADPRFDDAMVRILYKGVTGYEPLDVPGASATPAEVQAYQAEASVLSAAKAKYLADNRNLKTLLRELVLSPYWRADGLQDTAYAQVHKSTGSAILLGPEQLHRKLKALFGFEWRGPLDQYSANQNVFAAARLLSARQYYQQLYGGIDSKVVTERLTDPNGLMVKVQERMANEMACYAVPNDFLSAPSQRKLFPSVETATTLSSEQNQAAVRTNIQHLHKYLLGETLDINDPEITHTYNLFAAVLQDGQSKLGKTETTALPTHCARTKDLLTGQALTTEVKNDSNYTIRAWMAVVAYLLADYRFLYQ